MIEKIVIAAVFTLIGFILGWLAQRKFGAKVAADTTRLEGAVKDLKDTVKKL